jgi:hypothetical protein
MRLCNEEIGHSIWPRLIWAEATYDPSLFLFPLRAGGVTAATLVSEASVRKDVEVQLLSRAPMTYSSISRTPGRRADA